jgi:hypothetical protein
MQYAPLGPHVWHPGINKLHYMQLFAPSNMKPGLHSHCPLTALNVKFVWQLEHVPPLLQLMQFGMQARQAPGVGST